jgi:hypothetical protein
MELSWPDGQETVDFRVSGEIESAHMGDAPLEVRRTDDASNKLLAVKDVTVLWVELTGKNKGAYDTPPVYANRGYVFASGYPVIAGVIMSRHDPTNRGAHGSIELRGVIHPGDFDLGQALPVNPHASPVPNQIGTGKHVTVDLGFVFERISKAKRRYIDQQEDQTQHIDNEEDDSWLEIQDITPDKDPFDNNNLVIVDTDGPSTGGLDGGSDTRQRADFTEWVTFTYQVAGVRTVVPCSGSLFWATRMRIVPGIGGQPPMLWSDVNDYPNDGRGENEVLVGRYNPDLNP